MKISASLFVAGSVLLVGASEFIPGPFAGIGLIGNAHAIVGAPMTPVSVAGVARRTAVRTTAVVATTAATTSAAAAAQAAAAAPPPPPAPAPTAGSPAIGAVVGKLPNGCVSAPISGVEYYLCNGIYYRAAFQGNNLVYVVSKP